jgi:hypothetical protein
LSPFQNGDPHIKTGIGKLSDPHFNTVITILIWASIHPHFKIGIPMIPN